MNRLGLINKNKLNGKKYYYKEVDLSKRAVELANQFQNPKPKFMVSV